MANSLRAKIKKLHHDGKISAEECVELLEKLDGHDQFIRDMCEPKWIPVEERLPEVGETVLVCKRDYGGVGDISIESYTNNHSLYSQYWDACVVAWMPLPVPYQPPKMQCEED